MNDMNGSRPEGLQSVLAELERLRDAKQAEVEVAKQVFDSRMAELKQINGMLRAAQPPGAREEKPGRSRQARYGQEELRILVERIGEMASVVEDIPGSFTVPAIAGVLGLSQSQADRAVKALRAQGLIRMVGERRVGGASRTSRIFVLSGEPSDG